MSERLNIKLDGWMESWMANWWMEVLMDHGRNGHMKNCEASKELTFHFSCQFSKDGSRLGSISWWEARKYHGLKVFLIIRNSFPDSAHAIHQLSSRRHVPRLPPDTRTLCLWSSLTILCSTSHSLTQCASIAAFLIASIPTRMEAP